MNAGSAAQVLLAWEEPERIQRGLTNATFSAVALSTVRRRGWAQSVAEREAGVASVSAPVRSPAGKVIAAVSVSRAHRAPHPPARTPPRPGRDGRGRAPLRGAASQRRRLLSQETMTNGLAGHESG
jgi:hypothetical protein